MKDRLKLEGAVVGWKQVPDSDFTVKNLRKARKKHEQPSERTTAGRAASGTMSENHSTEGKPVQKEPFCTSRRTSFCTKKNLETQGFFKLRMMGLEPIRSHLRKILSLVRLPFRHIRLYSGTFSAPEQKIYYHRFLDLASLF